MANALYDPGREGFLDGSIDWDTNNMKVMLVKNTYGFLASNKFLTDAGNLNSITPAGADNGRTANLGSKTVTNGVADAADTSLTATSAVACNAIIIYQDPGTGDANCRLIAYIDNNGTNGLPLTPGASSTVNIVWDNGSNKIFKL